MNRDPNPPAPESPEMTDNAHRAGRLSAGLGGAVWLAAIAGLSVVPGPADLRWAAGLFLLAPLVLLPLALPLAASIMHRSAAPRLWTAVRYMQFPAAMPAAVSFLLPTGPWAGGLATPWLLMTGLISVVGTFDLFAAKSRPLERLCCHAAMIFVPIGGVAAVMSRMGLTVFGFSDIIILATAVHFHYTGFVLLILTGKTIEQRPGVTTRVASILAIAGIPALAVGITLSRFEFRYPEWLAAAGLSVVAIIIALSQGRLALRKFSGGPRLLLLLSALSLIAAMCMSILFAAGVLRGVYVLGIDIPWMLRYHAVINAFGFALCGLVAWHLIERRRTAAN